MKVNNGQSIYTVQNIVRRDYSKRMHKHSYTQAAAQTCASLTVKTGTCCKGRQQSGAENMAGLLLWKKKCLEVRFVGVQRGFLSKRKGEGHFV